jgi:hypothetical protein
MASHIEGERLIIAATLDPVETGQEFERMPPHMTIVRWFQMQENRHYRVTGAMDRMFTHQAIYQNLRGAEHATFGEEGQFKVRVLTGVETGPSFGLRALVRSLGSFREDDIYADRFSAHVTDVPGHEVRRGQKLALPTVALISAHSDASVQRVVESFKLGQKNDG